MAAGVALAGLVGAPPLLALLGAAFATVVGAWHAARGSGPRRSLALLLLGCVAGIALHGAAHRLQTRSHPPLDAAPPDALLRVRMLVREAASPLHPSGGATAQEVRSVGRTPAASIGVQVLSVDAGSGPRPVDGATSRLIVGQGVPDVLPGDVVEAVVQLFRPSPPGNPGALSSEQRQRRGAVRWLLLAPSAEALRPAATTPRAGLALTPVRLATRLRVAVERELAAHCSAADAGLLAGLLLGDRTAVLECDRRSFERSGTMHILSVSGLHVVLVLAAWGALLSRSGLARRTQLLALLLAAAMYVCLAGLRTPVTRAGIMAATAIVGWSAGRRVDGWSALAAAAIVLLCFDPLAVFRPGWQLSFGAVAALLLAARRSTRPPAPGTGPRWQGRLTDPARTSLVAVLGTAPLVWFHFGAVAPAALAANLIAIPVLALLLVGGLTLLPLLLAGGVAAQAAAWLLGAGCALLRGVVETFAEVPGGWVSLPPIGAATAVVLLLALAWLATGAWRRRPRRSIAGLALGAAWLVAAPAMSPSPDSQGHWVFDVGQGSATLIQTVSGRRILVDAGSSSLAYGGGRELRRALGAIGVGRLDLLVLSHADADHINAVAALAEAMPIDDVWVAPGVARRSAGAAVLAALRARGARVTTVRDGMTARDLGGGAQLRVLHPSGDGRLTGNEGSLVVWFGGPEGSLLIPGDIEEHGTADLLARHGGGLRCDVLIAPHHGGRNDRLPSLLDQTSPRAVVLSAGRRFPVAATLAELARRRIPAWQTAQCGAIRIRLGPEPRIFGLKGEPTPGR